ncbi:LPS translocon maturation chaperone LptM [Shimwellia blattae]|uniref:LPS-assembly lipoprotein LptM n=1 Tax=Shimwellia blattae (strain ATCC 29907 / DSM 4481 / JCM 1650 / NBRC 105725 / CDC 9005-74) TaxID=630626 RepID=I2BE62_SHIBC|nr:lipoprotein [Shimwellia blattae]AFJ48816.1 conserved hypothetical lipoprotein [Shimwellia blattae DSM 4481 = NBRC 105725]GAB82605.1 hypothetical protein YifL [Shimwellia blattae DSM 4481 = NBRC 105725]VDY66302.1 Predicted small periplasmic lipoprotein [Shimwellia blattae]VEC27721.1 Predicted small periplasmic lipoprotein [Shimwellia blattae]
MKNTLRTLAVVLVLFNLSGCGLKGPLYFPPEDGKPVARPTQTQTQTVRPDEPTRNDRAVSAGPTQVNY